MENEGILTPFKLAAITAVSAGAIFLTLFEGGTVLYFLQPVAIAISLAALAGEVAYRKDIGRKAAKMPEASTLILALALLAAASFTWSADKGATLTAVPAYLMYATAFWAASRMVPKARQATLFMIFLLSAGMLGYSLFAWAFADAQAPGPPSFPFAAADGFAALALVLSAFSLGLLFEMVIRGEGQGEGAVRMVKGFLFVVSAASAVVSWAALMVSGSPLAFCAAVLTAVLLSMLQGKESRLKALAVAVCFVAVAVALAWFLTGTGSISASGGEGASIFSRFGPRLAKELYDRAYQWTLALRLGLRSPLLGFGAGTFKDAMPLVYRPGLRPASADPMGLLVGSFAELGIAGFVLTAGLTGAIMTLAARKATSGRRLTPALLGPVIASTLSVLTGPSIPSVWLLYFIIAGCVSAEASKGKAGDRTGHGRLFAAAIVVVAVLSFAISAWSMAALPVKEEVLHHLGHAGAEGSDETYEDALVNLGRARSLDPFDKELLYEQARIEFVSESSEDVPDCAPAMQKVADLNARFPYYWEAYVLGGMMKKAQGLPWTNDIEQAALYSAGSIEPHLMLIGEGLNEGDIKLAEKYVGKALEERDQLLYRAQFANVEGVVALSYLVELEAKAYVLYMKLGDEDAATLEAGRMKGLYELNTAVEEHVRTVLGRYGMRLPD